MPNNSPSLWQQIKNFFGSWTPTWIKNFWPPKNQDPANHAPQTRENNDAPEVLKELTPNQNIEQQPLISSSADIGEKFKIYQHLNNLVKDQKIEEADKFFKENKKAVFISEGSWLNIASHLGDINLVHYLIEKGEDLNTKDNAGYTPLHSAVVSGNLDIVNVLLNHTQKLEEQNILGDTPLLLATKCYLTSINQDNEYTQKRMEIIQVLLEKGADINAQNKSNRTILDNINDSSKDCSELVATLRARGAKTSDELNTKWQNKVSQEPDSPGRAGGGGPGL